MSLVVARKIGNDIFIISDTRLTSYQDEKLHSNIEDDNCQKVFIISPQITFAFAGGIHYADKAFLKIQGDVNTQYIIDVLLRFHIESLTDVNGITEFILALGHPKYKLLVFQEGKVCEAENVWLGSKEAFSLFQKRILGKQYDAHPVEPNNDPNTFQIISDVGIILSPYNGSNSNVEFSDLYSNALDAMMSIILSGQIKEVGGFCIPVAYDRGQFSYMHYAKSYYGKQIFPSISDKPQAYILSFGSKEMGSLAVCMVNGRYENKKQYLGFHFLHGNFGVLFTESDQGLPRPQLYSNSNAVEFAFEIKAKYSLEILPGISIGFSYELFNAMASRFFSQGNFLKALEISNAALDCNFPDVEFKKLLCERAGVFIQLRDYKSAITDLFTAWPVEGRTKEIAFFSIGLCLLHLKKYFLSIRYFTFAIAENPKNQESFFNRHLCFWELGIIEMSKSKLDLAMIDLEKAIELGFQTDIMAQRKLQYIAFVTHFGG